MNNINPVTSGTIAELPIRSTSVGTTTSSSTSTNNPTKTNSTTKNNITKHSHDQVQVQIPSSGTIRSTSHTSTHSHSTHSTHTKTHTLVRTNSIGSTHKLVKTKSLTRTPSKAVSVRKLDYDKQKEEDDGMDMDILIMDGLDVHGHGNGYDGEEDIPPPLSASLASLHSTTNTHGQERMERETSLNASKSGSLSVKPTKSSTMSIEEQSRSSSLEMEGSSGGGGVQESMATITTAILTTLTKGLEYIKYIYSMILLLTCVILVMACIFQKQSTAADSNYQIPPLAAFFIFWFLILWLATMEGGQGCLVGLQTVDKRKYAHSHPRTFKNTTLAHRGNNMERFIIGRQFLVVLVIFLINLCGSALADADPLGLPSIINAIFLENGVAMMITTIVIGQLTSQVNAAVCMLDFINNYFMLFTTYVSLALEFSGVLHCVYLVQIGFAHISGKPIESNELPRNGVQSLFFWVRVVMSSLILGGALAVTLRSLSMGYSGMWDGVPTWASILLFFVLMSLVGLMDGMQIAAFALINMPKEELERSAVANANCQLIFSGQNLLAFLIGRQIFVASLMFIVARIASLSVPEEEDNLFGVGDELQKFFDTGLLGAVVLTIIGSLAWRIVASSFPLAFMSNPVIYVIIRICLFLEASGICSASWVLARIHKAVVNYQPDDLYLSGTVPPEPEDESLISLLC